MATLDVGRRPGVALEGSANQGSTSVLDWLEGLLFVRQAFTQYPGRMI